MMKRIFIFIILILAPFALYSQTSCYKETRSRGIALYNKGQYQNAIKAFSAAKSCPDKPQSNDLGAWIKKCNDKINTNTPVPQAPVKRTDTYIKVDGNSSTSSSHPASGGTEYFNISTDAKSWSTWGIPSWCSIENKTSRSFSLRVNANTSTSERSDYMEVRTPNGHSARINIKQSGKANTNKANIENVTVSHDETINGESGMKINMKLTISEKKGKKCSVVAYFYAEDGNSLKDTNGKYKTTRGDVCAFKDITPSYESSEWKSLSITIPYSELHLPSSGRKTVKFEFVVWDESVSPNESIFRSEYYTTSFYYSNSYLKVDGSSLDKTKHFSESGGRERYIVDTSDNSYETWGVPSWCSIEDRTSSGFTLVCGKNTSSSSRSDYMKVKAAGKEIRIDIKQDECSGPTASITSIEQVHNVFNGFTKGMNIKLKFSVSGMKGRSVKATALFYYGDNVTELKNIYGGQVQMSKSDVAPYEDTDFTMTLFIPYQSLNMGRGWNGSLSFDVIVSDSSGKKLARENNSTFTYSQPF